MVRLDVERAESNTLISFESIITLETVSGYETSRDGSESYEERICQNHILGHTRGNTRRVMYGQDLLDDDLINPISDNEYVLKGSEISNSTIKDEKVSKQKDQFLQEDTKTTSKEDQNQSHNSSETSMYISTKSSSEIEQESPNFSSETSTLTEDSINSNKAKQDDHQNPPNADKTVRSSTFYSSLLSNKKNKKKTNKVTVDEKINPSSEPQLSKGSNGPTNILRNLINCGPLDTNDSAVVAMNKQGKNDDSKPHFMSKCSSDLRNIVHQSEEICKRDHRLGGSQRVFGTPSWTQQQYWSCRRKSFDGVKDSLKNKTELREQRAPCAAYMPVNVPNCSQCGKPFKPEKLHAHMKACKGMKAISKTAADVDKASKGSMESKNGDSVSGSLLAH
ncbi:protein upstream of flc [Phtheirospermum japonicum]|uniref:Protein upstream of flc n=1 Tax=Phtheirospermum japonicum TaxID=374723 RepID=A0A830D929_9LAMI|nr:protein upstream of flc [Phtheirospermum japonicum]